MKRSIAVDANIDPATTLLPLPSSRIERIIEFCLPVQKHRPSAREEIKFREKHMEKLLLAQQKPVLRLAGLNERLIVFGGAGTGKTLIAIEVALCAAEQGRRVALLCFNQLVGEWMRNQVFSIVETKPNLLTGRAIQVMARMAGLEIPNATSSDYWESILPQQLEDKLTDPDFRATANFDYLVVDEAQDLLARSRLWTCLSQFLAGGLEHGRFALFGDFDNQVLTKKTMMEKNLSDLNAIAKPSHWRLTENSRNYRIVGDTAIKLSGLSNSVYSEYLRNGGGLENYDIAFYENMIEQLEILVRWLKDFKEQGYKPSEITLLSFRSDDASAAISLQEKGFKLRSARSAKDCTGFASVHSFKGMENKVIFLTDVVLKDREIERHLFYTGITRATESVRVLCVNKCQSQLRSWITGKKQL